MATITEYYKENLDKALEKFENFDEKEFMDFFTNLTPSEAEYYGFRRWSKENSIYLIPGCFMEFIPVGIELISISGKKIKYNGSNIDDDTRGGLLAYGLRLKEEK